jgi:hypothetical protein
MQTQWSMKVALPTRAHTRWATLSACAGCLAMALVWMLLATSVAHASTCAAQNNYTGASNGAWNVKESWSKGAVPTATETVCIPEGEGTITVPAGIKVEVKTILAQSGLSVAAGATLTITEKASFGGPKVNEEIASRFAALTVDGTIATDGDWLLISGNVLLEGEIAANGTQTQKNETTARLLSGTLTGNGTFNIAFGNVGGTIEPGGPGVIGALHLDQISGQSSTGTLVIDIKSATEFDKIDMGSNIGWAGTLDVNVLAPYEPTVGTAFLFETGGGAIGVFEHLTEGFEQENEPSSYEVRVSPRRPTVITEAATDVTQTTAILNGTVNPNNESVTGCEFEYGTTTSYGSFTGCGGIAFHGNGVVPTDGVIYGLSAGTTYHFRISATNHSGTNKGLDRSFTTLPAGKSKEEEPPIEKLPEETPSTGGGGSTTTTTTTTPGTTTTTPTIGPSTLPGAIPVPVATAPKAVEELLLGCSSSPLVLNDAYIHGGRVLLIGSAAKSLVGKRVEILFNERKQVATATVGAGGQFATTAPLPPAKIREALTTRYTAEVGKVRSLHLKLTRRLLLEPPTASGTTVTLSGQVTLPLTKPVAPVTVEQQLECGKTTVVKTFTPPANGHFSITLTVPANARAGIYRLTSKVAANMHAVKHGFTTFSLPLPVTLG